MPGPLDGRVAVVTGANHGIGAATAVALAGLGADVAVAYLAFTPDDDDPDRPDAYRTLREQGPEATVAAIEAAGRRAVTIDADLTEDDAPARTFQAAEAALGPVSILVNNGSAWRPDTFAAGGRPVTAESALPQLLVDARAAALLIAELASSVRRHGLGWGRIVGLTSGGPNGFPGEVSYGAAKAALESYTLSAASELAADGITANVVHPPVTDTGWVTDAVRAFVDQSPEHHHVAEPAEVAEVVAWLCTDAARLVTGNVIRLR